SRRRHTRFSRDWSSDVCSSDLLESLARLLTQPAFDAVAFGNREIRQEILAKPKLQTAALRDRRGVLDRLRHVREQLAHLFRCLEIGRASCRERGWIWVGAV